ncbi:hypothetical protein KI811_09695 [Geobacter hydrogenophilus]|uniref:Uncharacterized protein n=2 Tax=Geobacter hydrogenophilus TaxID=40983 RepID=A0A9W6G037_9BACT|nr:hypothetical protein [Geobacter hydrogenophilus]MBT0894081.1 hypothetical protein [Geobacter hydrogenophilus]GLI37972.1 hypothetical protein GHYDROH2_14730 [Geobacter hydrogenophilus]
MLIRVRYQDNTYDMVKAWRLEEYIATGKISAFHRGNEWVAVSRDQVRHSGDPSYGGPERRRRENNLSRVA